MTVAASARAEEPDTGFAGPVVSPGAMVAWAGSKGYRFDGELAGTFYWNRFGLGAATGGNPDRFYFELQPVALFDLHGADGKGAGTIFVGINPGLVVDWSGPTRVGGQLTLWGEYLYACCHGGVFALPLVPFARLDVFAREYVASVGFMLKLGIPVPWSPSLE